MIVITTGKKTDTVIILSILLGIESGEFSREDAATLFGMGPEFITEARKATLAALRDNAEDMRKERASEPAVPTVPVVGRYAWFSAPKMPVIRVKILSVDASGCRGCGRRGATIEIVEASYPSPGFEVGTKVSGACVDKMMFEDDPANADQVQGFWNALATKEP